MFQKSLEWKVLSLIMVALATILLFLMWLDSGRAVDTDLKHNEEKARMLSSAVMKSIENIMLSGQGTLVREALGDLRTVEGVENIHVYNKDGRETFSDSDSVDIPVFSGKAAEILRTGQETEFTPTIGGKELFSQVRLLKNESSCQGCHGSDHAYQGVVIVSTSMEEVKAQILNIRILMAVFAIVTLLVIGAILKVLLRITILRPLDRVVKVIKAMTGGDLDQRVVIDSADEVGVLASNLNTMAESLKSSQESLRLTNEELQMKNREIERSHLELEASNRALLTFIQEMHHRIKNNLQTIADLLSLEMQRAGASPVATSLGDTIARIKSIAAVHEILSLENMELTDFKRVANVIVDTVAKGMVNPSQKIDFTVSGDNVLIPSKQAIALALVLNELVANAIKHAFNGRETGVVVVSLSEGEKDMELLVQDDGRGLPKGFDLVKSSHLGLQIVQTLVKRELNGVLQLYSNKGTTASVRVPK